MQEIKELILLLHQHIRPVLQHHPLDFKPGPGLAPLYDGISQGLFTSDSEAVAKLFPGAMPDHPAYIDLKKTLRTALLAWITNFNARLLESNDLEYVYRECNKQWLVICCFSGENAHNLVLPLTHQLLEVAEKFEFTRMSIDMYALLCIQFCLGNHRDVTQCNVATQKHTYYQQLLEAEHTAEEQYINLNTLAANYKISRKKINQLAKTAHARLKKAMRKYKSYKLTLYGNLLGLLQHMSAGEARKVLQICSKTIRLFEQKPYNAGLPLQVFYYMQLVANIELGRLAAGLKALANCVRYVEPGSFNWFKFQELAFILLMHTQRYDKAFALLQEVARHPQLAALPDYARQSWQLYRQYLQALQHLGAPMAGADFAGMPPLQTFQNPSGKVVGLQCAQLVLDWLTHLQRGDFDALRLLSGQLARFAADHLKSPVAKRSYFFLKLLEEASNPDATPVNSRKYLARLAQIPVQVANQTLEMEVVRYEHLWKIIQKVLQNPESVKRNRASGA
ncbi:MAG: hypothetical protein H6569_11135 [Lewinellaceae bacterium]|nr:hypothetical protein [Lewinellaceae bacterium]